MLRAMQWARVCVNKCTEICEGEGAGNGALVAKKQHCCEML